MQPTITLAALMPLVPEILIAVAAMVILMIGAFRAGPTLPDGRIAPAAVRAGENAMWLAILVLAGATYLVVAAPAPTATLFGGSFVGDAYARFFKVLILTGAIGALLLSFDYLKTNRLMQFEYPVLVLLAVVGMMIMVSAGDLMALYLGLELQSLALYVLAAMKRDDVKSSEAGLKYFVLGSLSSGMLLYGASLIYGFTGSTQFAVIAQVALQPGAGQNVGLVVGLVFLMVGLAFKVSAVPFHMWTPDVYEGAPTPVTAFFSAVPKLAAMAMLVRVLSTAFPVPATGKGVDWQQIVVFLALASMFLGAFAAIGQNNIKRLLAYSSIGHVGYALIGLAAANEEGIQSVLIYLAIYVPMTLGAFACVLAMRRESGPVEDIRELAGLSRTHPTMAVIMAALTFSLAGIPILAGFFAKLFVFRAAVTAELWTLAVLGVIASVIGAYYYLRIVKIMFFDEAREPFAPIEGRVFAVMALAGVFVTLFVVVPSPLVDAALAAARSLKGS